MKRSHRIPKPSCNLITREGEVNYWNNWLSKNKFHDLMRRRRVINQLFLLLLKSHRCSENCRKVRERNDNDDIWFSIIVCPWWGDNDERVVNLTHRGIFFLPASADRALANPSPNISCLDRTNELASTTDRRSNKRNKRRRVSKGNAADKFRIR